MARPSGFSQSTAAVAAPAEVKAERTWSAQQLAVFQWFVDGVGNLLVRARAGTGKTTTIIEGINRAPETDIALFAFNKKIADELNNRITNEHATAMTLHSLGYRAIKLNWGYIKVADGQKRAWALTDAVAPYGIPKPIHKLVSVLHSKGRELIARRDATVQEMVDLAIRFDLLPDEGYVEWPVERVAGFALKAMQHAAD